MQAAVKALSSRRPILWGLSTRTNRSTRLRYLSSAKKQGGEESQQRHVLGRRLVVAAAAGTIGLVSYQARQWRKQKIEELPLITDDGIWNTYYPTRSLPSVVQIVERAGLMGKSQSVKEELEDIRVWHQANGFKGGLILRDLTKPLFGLDGGDSQTDVQQQPDLSIHEILEDPTRLARRECYYLYYELKGNGESQQQIFCRGTTLTADILTCLEAWMVYDEDLQCRVHKGFRNQADRILKDVIPLLTPPNDRRGTIEVCGHSLGGAAATILAAKLRRKGYRVVRLTTIGEPRLCATRRDADKLTELLPKDQLRIENDKDFVPFLPPFGTPTANKIWIANDSLRLVPKGTDWAESVWINFHVFEILASMGRPHRIPTYVQSLKRAVNAG